MHVILRSIPLHAYAVLLPLHATLRGLSNVEAGWVLALFLLFGAVGSLVGGYLSDRLPRRPLMVLTEIGAGICLLLAPVAAGAAFYVALAAASVLFYVAMPLQIVMAQERSPRIESVASGIVMGFAYGISGLMLVPLGWLGDYLAATTGSELVGVTRILQVASLSLFAAAAVAVFLRPRPPSAVFAEVNE